MAFLDYYKERGHQFGECMSRADSELMYVYIPKNATSWTKPNLQDWGWEFYNYHTDGLMHKTALVVLRNPVERWVSGIAEYLYLYHRDIDTAQFNTAFYDIVFDKVAFDDHTERQSYFINGLDRSRCVFFNFDNDYRVKFSKFLTEHNMPNRYYNYEPQHVSDNDAKRREFKKLFREQLQNSKYLNQIEDYFRQDLQLIESVNFYE